MRRLLNDLNDCFRNEKCDILHAFEFTRWKMIYVFVLKGEKGRHSFEGKIHHWPASTFKDPHSIEIKSRIGTRNVSKITWKWTGVAVWEKRQIAQRKSPPVQSLIFSFVLAKAKAASNISNMKWIASIWDPIKIIDMRDTAKTTFQFQLMFAIKMCIWGSSSTTFQFQLMLVIKMCLWGSSSTWEV